MRFEAQHEFSASCARVADVLCDPEFHAHLELPDLSRPAVVEHHVDGTTRVLRLRYEYIGQLDPIARKIIGSRKVAWTQELRLDTTTFAGTLTFEADADPRRLNGLAQVVITVGDDAEHSRRRIAGDFHVRIPLVGGKAEHSIVPGLVRRLDVEATALAAELDRRG